MNDEANTEPGPSNDDLAEAARRTIHQMLSGMHELATKSLYDEYLWQGMPALATGVGTALDILTTLSRLDGPQSITTNPGTLPGSLITAKPKGA